MSDFRIIRIFSSLGLVLILLFSRLVWSTTEVGSETYEVYFDNITSQVKAGITDYVYNDINLVSTNNENSDIIISFGTYTDYSDSYDSYEIAQSRMVVRFPTSMSAGDACRDNFSTYSNGTQRYCTTDIKKTLEAIIESSSGEVQAKDIGFSTKQTLTFALPDNGYLYKREIIDTIIMILSDGDLNENNKDEVIDKLNVLISKSEVVSGYNDLLKNNKEYVFIIPEVILADYNGYTIRPIYWSDNTGIKVMIHFKKEFDESVKERIIEGFDSRKTLLKKAYLFGNSEQTLASVQCYFADRINLKYISSDFTTLLGQNYWK